MGKLILIASVAVLQQILPTIEYIGVSELAFWEPIYIFSNPRLMAGIFHDIESLSDHSTENDSS